MVMWWKAGAEASCLSEVFRREVVVSVVGIRGLVSHAEAPGAFARLRTRTLSDFGRRLVHW